MTKTLTEQWCEGTLPDGFYYVVSKWSGKIEINDYYDGCWQCLKEEYIKEVVATVPSYDEYKRLVRKTDKLEKMAFHYTPEEWNTMMRMVERLQEQLKEANAIIDLYFPKDKKINSVCVKPINDYRKKWGAK